MKPVYSCINWNASPSDPNDGAINTPIMINIKEDHLPIRTN